jgi:hypothetical protein
MLVVMALYPMRSSALRRSDGKRRIESRGPSTASGGMIALTREPSGSRASTIGELSSMRRPTPLTMRSITRSRCWSSWNAAGTLSSLPRRSTNTCLCVLTRMSLTVLSRRSGSSGPKPNTSSSTSPRMASRSPTDNGMPVSPMSVDTSARISPSTDLRSDVASFSRLRRVSSLRCTLPRTSRYWARRASLPGERGTDAGAAAGDVSGGGAI